jgi:predicted ABC-type ATPase
VAALAAGRLFLKELDRLAKARLDFAFESTLSGLVYLNRLKRWKTAVIVSRLFIFVCLRRALRCAASRRE